MPDSSAEHHLSRGEVGEVLGPARFDIHLPSPAIVSFRARKEGGDFSQSIMNSDKSLSSLPSTSPLFGSQGVWGASRALGARAAERPSGPGRSVSPSVRDPERAALQQEPLPSTLRRVLLLGAGLRELCVLLPGPGGVLCGSSLAPLSAPPQAICLT